MKLRTVAIIASVGIILGLIGGGFQTCSLRAQRDAWRRKAALNDSLHQIDAGRFQRAAVALENERQLRAAYEDSFPLLYREMRNLKARERVYVRTIATMEADTAVTTASDTVYISTEGINVSRVDFHLDFDGCIVDGFTITPPPRALAKIVYKPIPISVFISQLRDGSLQTNVETEPWVIISELNTSIVVPKPSWLTRKLPWITFAGGFLLSEIIR